MADGQGTREDPWVLKTPPGTSEFQLYRDPDADPPHAPRGCPWQAWSVGELLRLEAEVLAPHAPAPS